LKNFFKPKNNFNGEADDEICRLLNPDDESLMSSEVSLFQLLI